MKCQRCGIKLNKIYKTLLTCKCENVFCWNHRTNHGCDFDYQKENNETLKNNLPIFRRKEIKYNQQI